MLSLSGIMYIIIFNYCEIRLTQIIVGIINHVMIENDTWPKMYTEQCLLGNRSS